MGHPDNIIRTGQIETQQDKFITADPEQPVGFPDNTVHSVRDPLQDLVPRLVPHGVVHVLKVVQIYKQQRQRSSGTFGPEYFIGQVPVQGNPVRKPGYRVLLHHQLQPFIRGGQIVNQLPLLFQGLRKPEGQGKSLDADKYNAGIIG